MIMALDNSNGLIGAALATLVSVIILNALFIIQAKLETGIFPFKKRMIRILLILIIPFFLIFYIQSKIDVNLFYVLFLTLGFLLLYFLLLILFKGLDQKDVMIAKAILKKINFFKKF